MKKIKNDNKYMSLVDDILSNTEYQKLKEYKHHGDNRMNHCIRVSYYSYLVAKKFNLDYIKTARAGLLHDFFLVNNQEVSIFERIKVLFIHPRIACSNSKKYFELSKKEENIILSHMFPFFYIFPNCMESLLVNFVDNVMAIYERYFTIKNSLGNAIKSIVTKTPLSNLLKSNS